MRRRLVWLLVGVLAFAFAAGAALTGCPPPIHAGTSMAVVERRFGPAYLIETNGEINRTVYRNGSAWTGYQVTTVYYVLAGPDDVVVAKCESGVEPPDWIGHLFSGAP